MDQAGAGGARHRERADSGQVRGPGGDPGLGLDFFLKKPLFGTGKLEVLREKITSVFISLYQLTVTQRLELERLFSVPVIDR